MITVRLSRVGKRNDPFYKIVALPKRSKRDGGNLDVLGTWFPKKDALVLDEKKLKDWIGKGAQVSPTVKKLAKLA